MDTNRVQTEAGQPVVLFNGKHYRFAISDPHEVLAELEADPSLAGHLISDEDARIAAKDAERSERLQALLGISDATARYGNKDNIIDSLLAKIDDLQGQS